MNIPDYIPMIRKGVGATPRKMAGAWSRSPAGCTTASRGLTT